MTYKIAIGAVKNVANNAVTAWTVIIVSLYVQGMEEWPDITIILLAAISAEP